MKLSLSRAAEFMQATGEFDHAAVASGYSIDSRSLQPGDLFFAVRGERLDGHDFVETALAKGAVGAVVGKDQAARFTAEEPDSGGGRSPSRPANPRCCRAPVVGQAADRRHRFSWQNHDQRSHRARAGHQASSAEIRKAI